MEKERRLMKEESTGRGKSGSFTGAAMKVWERGGRSVTPGTEGRRNRPEARPRRSVTRLGPAQAMALLVHLRLQEALALNSHYSKQ